MERWEERAVRDVIYQTYFYDRLMSLLDVGTTPQYFKLSRVYWWTLTQLGLAHETEVCSLEGETWKSN